VNPILATFGAIAGAYVGSKYAAIENRGCERQWAVSSAAAGLLVAPITVLINNAVAAAFRQLTKSLSSSAALSTYLPSAFKTHPYLGSAVILTVFAAGYFATAK
jgi:hypothetical protein